MFDKFILQNEDEKERLNYLSNSADEVLQQEYHVKLTSDELTSKRAIFTNESLKLRKIEMEKKDFMDEIKERIKPIKSITDDLATELNTGYARHFGKLYQMIDHDTKMVGFYAESGELIETLTRPATREELSQLTIAHSARTGTNN